MPSSIVERLDQFLIDHSGDLSEEEAHFIEMEVIPQAARIKVLEEAIEAAYFEGWKDCNTDRERGPSAYTDKHGWYNSTARKALQGEQSDG